LSWFLKKEGRMKWAVIPFLMGLSLFIIEIFILTPYVRRGLPMSEGAHWVRYTQFGQTPREILFFLATHPFNVLTTFFSYPNTIWYKDLFGLCGCLAFLSPHILLPALPLFLKTLLSSDPQEHVVLYGYY